MESRIETLRKAQLFGRLDDSVLELIASRIVEKRLEPNGILFIAGEPADGLYVVAEGSVRAFAPGPMVVNRSSTSSGPSPPSPNCRFSMTGITRPPSRRKSLHAFFFIAKEDIRSISLTHPQLAIAAVKLFAARLRQCAELVESLSPRDVSQRIAKVLAQEAMSRGEMSGTGASFVQRLTHSQLAARIGTVREVVSRSMTRLESAGLIAINGKKVEVPDIDALRNYADS